MKFRFARHTSNLSELKSFYQDILGMDVLGSFEDHDGYDGIFLGFQNESWHLEFTQNNVPAKHVFDEEDSLVFYLESKVEYDLLLERLKRNNISIEKAKNPYWNNNGTLFHDPDGYQIIISNLKM